ncbi:MAG: NlpC/P60 family protein [Ancrocorticia sp.]|nr:NlpC/P60 family protein [Ancrocorticia sp.]MCI1932285.1 NlpC/P60 family protein [Ancrocorticia sp.]MCI2178014.1 NlpC/P60 family protein [Ancrocorticia sp.]MCI2193027.1 NlpC/P60 family protein [Ancrocorticia sp.]MCI2198297.1 NlpC/P60 family protein [Ancrocorticia sp.]
MRNRRVGRPIASVAALLVAAGMLSAPASADPTTDDQLQQAKDAETQTADSIASLEVELAQLAAQSNDLDMKVAEAQAAKIKADGQVNKAMADLTSAEEAFLKAAANAEDARKELAEVSNTIYREGVGSIATASYLLGAQSLEEANEKSRAYQMLGLDTDKQVQEYEALQSVATSLKAEMDKTVSGYKKAADDAAAAADAVTKAQAEVKAQEAKLASQRSKLITQLAAQKGTTAQLEEQIQAQKEAAAKEQAEKEQQELIAKAEASVPATPTIPTSSSTSTEDSAQETAKTQTTTTTKTPTTTTTTKKPTTTTTTKTPTTTTTTKTPTTTTTTKTPTTTTTTKATTTSGTSSTSVGSGTPEVIALARQYIGYPYVWGTGGPNTFDCAGFTKFIYAKIGITLPFSSSAQRYVGTQVSASEAKPGDLLWWPGHVAIYLGNGQNIGAWNPSMGVREGPNSWIGEPIYIRLR